MAKESLRKRANKASKFRSKTLICVVENPKNMGNLRGIVRTAEALCIGKIFVIDNGRLNLPKDWQKMRENSRLKKKSASGIKWIFVKVFPSTYECLKYLEKNNFTNVGTSPHKLGEKNISLSEGKYTQNKLAVWFGNEANGLSKEALKACEFCVQIKMYGIIESMNLSSSASIILNYIVEERQKYSKKKLSKRAKKKANQPNL